MVNGGYTAELGAQAIVRGETDLIAYGVPFLANPDLVERCRTGAPLNAPDFALLRRGCQRLYRLSHTRGSGACLSPFIPRCASGMCI